MAKKSQLDLFTSAADAAMKSLSLKPNSLQEHKLISDAFHDSGFDEADFEKWREFYGENRTRFSQLAEKPLPSEPQESQ